MNIVNCNENFLYIKAERSELLNDLGQAVICLIITPYRWHYYKFTETVGFFFFFIWVPKTSQLML